MAAPTHPPVTSPGDDVRAYRHGTPAEREAAVARLAAAIRTAAERVTAAAHGDRDEFIDSAPAFLLQDATEQGDRRIDRYDAARPFFPWVRTVLRNRWRDVVRERSAARAREKAAAVPNRTTPPANWEPEWAEQVSRVVAALGVGRAVEFLAVEGVCEEVPPEQWEELVSCYEAEREAELARPFPPVAENGRGTSRTRTELVADALGMKANTLSVRYKRARERLQEAFAVASVGGESS